MQSWKGMLIRCVLRKKLLHSTVLLANCEMMSLRAFETWLQSTLCEKETLEAASDCTQQNPVFDSASPDRDIKERGARIA